MFYRVGICTSITRAGILATALFLAACPGGRSNSPPIADAGTDQTSGVLVGDAVVLDGSASSDADGDTLGYAWALTTVPPDSSAALADPSSDRPSFLADKPGTYVASLVVSDASSSSAPDEVSVAVVIPPPAVVIVTPEPESIAIASPVAVAGTVDDPLAAITVNGDPTPNSNGSYGTTVAIPEGGGTITVVATNSTGAGTATVNVYLKTASAPVISITNPQPGFTANLVLLSTTAAKDIPVDVRGTIVTANTSGSPTVTVNGVPATVTGAPVCPPGLICIAQAFVSRYNFSAMILVSKGQRVILAEGSDTLGGSAQAQVSGVADYCIVGGAEPGVPAERGNGQNNRCHEIDGCNRNKFGLVGSTDTVSLRNQPMPEANLNAVLVEFGSGYIPPSDPINIPRNDFFVHGQSPRDPLGCNIHDTCYQTCVPQGGGNQLQAFSNCNTQQNENHKAMCRKAYPASCPFAPNPLKCAAWLSEKANCFNIADTYFDGVATPFGADRYNERQDDYCLPGLS